MQQNEILNSATAQEAYEKACAHFGEEPKTLGQFNSFFGERTGYWEFSQHRITTTIEAVKEGKTFDWGNINQRKYSGWFDLRSKNNSTAGSAFSLYDVDFVGTVTYVGARLCSHDDEVAERIATLFLDDYQNWMKEKE